MNKRITIGIDATNLNNGGGKSHIINVIEHFLPAKHNIDKIIVYGAEVLLRQLPSNSWLDKRTSPLLNRGVFFRYIWLLFLSKKVFKREIDILFSPSGLYFGSFRPYVSMSRNMMLFDKAQIKAQKGLLKWKLILSRYMNIFSMKNANGNIFISEYAKNMISEQLALHSSCFCKINHGISDRFKDIQKGRLYNILPMNTINLLYVSHVYSYKHPWNVVEAVGKLKCEGYNVKFDIVGGGNRIDINRLIHSINKVDPKGEFVKYHGNQPYNSIHEFYKRADIFVYASTCENMPNILLEAMSSALPIACSNYNPMPEFLEEGGVYFNPLNILSIHDAIKRLIDSENLRKFSGVTAFKASEKYSWSRTSEATFSFIEKIFKRETENLKEM